MATGYADPNGDASPLEWSKAGGPPQTYHYQYVNDGTRQPSVPNTSLWLEGSGIGVQETLDMGTLTVGTVSSVTLWAYCCAVGETDITASINMGGWQEWLSLAPDMTYAWKSKVWDGGSWNQAAMDGLQIAFKQPAGGGTVQVAGCYAEITYTTTGTGARVFVID